MSLVVTLYVPSGIVMAADSRMTVLRAEDRGEGEKKTRVEQQLVLSDSAYKVVELKTVGVGMSLYDAGMIDNQPMESHVHRFEEEALSSNDDVRSVADKFMQYLQKKPRRRTSAFTSQDTAPRARPACRTCWSATRRTRRRSAASTPRTMASCSSALCEQATCWWRTG